MEIQASLGVVRATGTVMGRGVFAARRIACGEVIEVCPVLQIRSFNTRLMSELHKVVFDWEALAGVEGFSAIAFGYGSLYNHANPANARYRATPDAAGLLITAAADIEMAAEITINYNATAGEPQSADDIWFVATGVIPFEPEGS
ncbi:SET domain-containing protein-lysine N-methyltransferase [soil metagenome]